MMYVWNIEGNYSFHFSLRRDEAVVWDFERSGSGILGAVLSHELKITRSGEIVQK
jgi:hypothetical protein